MNLTTNAEVQLPEELTKHMLSPALTATAVGFRGAPSEISKASEKNSMLTREMETVPSSDFPPHVFLALAPLW